MEQQYFVQYGIWIEKTKRRRTSCYASRIPFVSYLLTYLHTYLHIHCNSFYFSPITRLKYSNHTISSSSIYSCLHEERKGKRWTRNECKKHSKDREKKKRDATVVMHTLSMFFSHLHKNQSSVHAMPCRIPFLSPNLHNNQSSVICPCLS